jgi:hypothetical protein
MTGDAQVKYNSIDVNSVLSARRNIKMAIRDLFYLLIEDYWKNIQPAKLRSLEPLKGKENRFAALTHFKNYAYERNVSAAASVYREVAGIALSSLADSDWTSDQAEARIWRIFKEECKKRGKRGIQPNIKVNPLRPSTRERKSLFAFVRNIPHYETIAAWAFRMISEGKIEQAHASLKTVWGVGDKIASFYLRDIFWLGHGLHPKATVEADYLLQPIDIWVERACKALGHTGTSKVSMAMFISSFEKEHNIAHGGANIGSWMLGSNYNEDPDTFKSVLQALLDKSTDSILALSIADRFEKFGSMLRAIVVHGK